MFGFGTYMSAFKSPAIGYFISVLPHIIILLFYGVDLLYKRVFSIRLNLLYSIMLIYLLSTVLALFIALSKNLPEATLIGTLTKSVLVVIPFHGFIAVILYNDNKKELLIKMTCVSLSLLLFINLLGYYGLGLSNEVHSIDGRLNFPFLDGFYSGASLLAIINLLLIHYLKKFTSNPLQFIGLAAFFIFNMVLFLMINSRLATMILLFTLALIFIRAIRLRGVYLLSMFTLPILMSSGLIIYTIMQWPGLNTLLRRVDLEDVTTFNGRAYLWQDAIDWLTKGQEGLFFGNGFKGHYYLGMVEDVAKLWNEKDVHHLHLHSSSLEILVSQGIIFFAVFAIILYKIYSYYRNKHKEDSGEGAFFPVIVYLLFIMQVDTFVYDDSMGFIILSFLVANAAVTLKLQVLKPPKQVVDFSFRKWIGDTVTLKSHSIN